MEKENIYAWIYAGVMIFLAILFFLLKFNTLRIIILAFFVVIQLVYTILEWKKREYIFNIVFLIIYLIYLIAYWSLTKGKFEITAISIILFAILVSLGTILLAYSNLKKAKKFWGKIIFYLLFSGLVILFFSILFVISNSTPQNRILDSDGRIIVGTIEYIWYSIGNFYVANFGEIPYGWSKSISYIEIAMSFLIHVGILQKIFGKED